MPPKRSKKKAFATGAMMRRVLDRWPSGREFTARSLYSEFRRDSKKLYNRASVARRAHDVIKKAMAEGIVLQVHKGTMGDISDKNLYVKL